MEANLKYVAERDKLLNPENVEEHAAFKVVVILMMATGVYRLYTREDFKNFLKRLAILASHYKVIDRFFIDNELLTFTTDNGGYSLTIEDIAICTGMMFGAHPHENIPFERWIDDIQKMVNNAIIGGFFSGVYLFTDDMDVSHESVDDNDHVNLSFKNIKERPSMNDVQNAEILAGSLLGELPVDLFDVWEEKFPHALDEYDKEFNRIKAIKHFKFDSLDPEVKEKIKLHFANLIKPDEYKHEQISRLIHFAWIWANEHYYYHPHGVYFVEEYIDFDQEQLEIDFDGRNLETIKDDFYLEELIVLLRENNHSL